LFPKKTPSLFPFLWMYYRSSFLPKSGCSFFQLKNHPAFPPKTLEFLSAAAGFASICSVFPCLRFFPHRTHKFLGSFHLVLLTLLFFLDNFLPENVSCWRIFVPPPRQTKGRIFLADSLSFPLAYLGNFCSIFLFPVFNGFSPSRNYFLTPSCFQAFFFRALRPVSFFPPL